MLQIRNQTERKFGFRVKTKKNHFIGNKSSRHGNLSKRIFSTHRGEKEIRNLYLEFPWRIIILDAFREKVR